tara:strand:+ start:2390 stop:3181 length:792 start_codon:yes stop_codon:yes gene_type:complete
MDTVKKTYTLESFVKLSRDSAKVRARILPADGTEIPLGSGKKITLTRELLEDIKDEYNASLKRSFVLGKIKYPKVYLEHTYTDENEVGHLASELVIEKHLLKGRYVDCLALDLMVKGRQDIVTDLESYGSNSNYAGVSVGVHFPKGSKPVLYELSLTANPFCEDMMMLKNEENIIDREKMELTNLLHIVEEDIKNNTMKLSIKSQTETVLDRHFALNRINRQQATQILKSTNFENFNEVSMMDKILDVFPMNRLNTRCSVSSS